MKQQHIGRAIKKVTSIIVCGGLLLQVTACGLILHPERKGTRRQGAVLQDLDWKILGLDMLLGIAFGGLGAGAKAGGTGGAIGGVVVGPIALFVDFYTGCIYKPQYSSGLDDRNENLNNWLIAKVEPETLNQATIEQVIREYTGQNIHLNSPNIMLFKPDNTDADVFKALKQFEVEDISTAQGMWFRGSEANFIHDASGRLVRIKITTPTDFSLGY